MFCGAGGGKDGGGASLPYSDEFSQLTLGSLANRLNRSDPAMGQAFRPGTTLGNSYRDIFGQGPPVYQGFGFNPQTTGQIVGGAYGGVYGPQGKQGLNQTARNQVGNTLSKGISSSLHGRSGPLMNIKGGA